MNEDAVKENYTGTNNQVQNERTPGLMIVLIVVALIGAIGGWMDHWDDWWMKFLIIPLFILGSSMWIWERIENWGFRKRIERLVFTVAICVLSALLFLCFYSRTSLDSLAQDASALGQPSYGPAQADGKPPQLPPGCDSVWFTYGGKSHETPIRGIGNREFRYGVDRKFSVGIWVTNRTFFVNLSNEVYHVLAYDERVGGGAGVRMYSFSIKVENFKLKSKVPPRYDWQQTSTDLEIVDAYKNPVFQMSYRSGDEVTVCGVFYELANALPSAYMVTKTNVVRPFNSRKQANGIQRLFEYPSSRNPGKYLEDR